MLWILNNLVVTLLKCDKKWLRYDRLKSLKQEDMYDINTASKTITDAHVTLPAWQSKQSTVVRHQVVITEIKDTRCPMPFSYYFYYNIRLGDMITWPNHSLFRCVSVFSVTLGPMLVWWWLANVVPMLARWTKLRWPNIGCQRQTNVSACIGPALAQCWCATWVICPLFNSISV